MQCMAPGWAARAIASGPKAGASMTSSRNLAIQREALHICVKDSSCWYSVSSIQYPPNRCHQELRTGNFIPAVPFLRAWADGTAVEDNSEAAVDSGGGPPGGGGFRGGGLRGAALPAAGVARRVRDRAIGCACKSQAARRRVGR